MEKSKELLSIIGKIGMIVVNNPDNTVTINLSDEERNFIIDQFTSNPDINGVSKFKAQISGTALDIPEVNSLFDGLMSAKSHEAAFGLTLLSMYNNSIDKSGPFLDVLMRNFNHSNDKFTLPSPNDSDDDILQQ